MAARLACHTVARQFCIVQKQIFYTYRPLSSASSHRLLTANNNHSGRLSIPMRLLHVKVYDTEAGLQAQREANQRNRRRLESIELEQRIEEKHAITDPHSNAAHEPTMSRQPVARRKPEQVIDEMPQSQPTALAAANEEELDDPDTFGTSKAHNDDDEKGDAGDRAEDEFLNNPTRRTKKLDTRQYAQLIKEHLNAHRVKQAVAVLEQRILKEDRAKPENYIYNLLISGCAKAGYTRKAFQLFTQMRQRDLKVTGGTYTSLFNACANAPSAVDGLSRAQRLRELMLEKAYEPNVMNYNAMIKAFGRCGDVQTAYLLADEMMERQLPLKTDTFNFLLQACASDKELGFRHCLLTWHKMLQRRILPDYYTFNVVLRCVRDTGLGDLAETREVLQRILSERTKGSQAVLADESVHKAGIVPATANDAEERKILVREKPRFNPFNRSAGDAETADALSSPPAVEDSSGADVAIRQHDEEDLHLQMPDLLAERPHLGSLVSLAEVKQPHDRLLLLGGMNGFLALMKQHHVTPDIETFTTLLEVVPPTCAAEKQVLAMIRRIGLKADIDFFNVLIKKRAMRFDYEGGREVLSMIRTAGLRPDIVTYGVLALGCRTVDEARELLQEMQSQDVRMNIQILGAMLRQGCHHRAFDYVMEIMQISLDHHVRPNDVFLRHLHNFYNHCARAIDARHPTTKTGAFKRGHAKFCDKLRLYHDEHGLTGLKLEDAIRHVTERPYEQYREPSDEGVEPLKNTSLARKQKIRKYIKKIKIDNLRNDVDRERERESEIKERSELRRLRSDSAHRENANNKSNINGGTFAGQGDGRDSDRRAGALESEAAVGGRATTPSSSSTAATFN